MASEDLTVSLQSYQIQLQQVEAALTNEPDNDELLKLQKDLQEVITLTKELLASSKGGAATTSSDDFGRSRASRWKTGDQCMAPWSEDNQYYEAVIEDITEDGRCIINFPAYHNTDVANLSQLKTIEKKRKIVKLSDGFPKTKKQVMQEQREYKKKKAQKKAQRMKQIEEEREKEKVKWHSFNTKAYGKNKKGCNKKSIFASPDNVNGRVGVGTCGIGGRPMTEYHQQEKWKKPMGPGHRMEMSTSNN